MIAIYNPFRDALKTYRKYDISKLESTFRSIMILKNRFGDCDVEVGTAFYGWINTFKELPAADEIYDYERYKSPNWTLDEKIQETDSESNFKFIM